MTTDLSDGTAVPHENLPDGMINPLEVDTPARCVGGAIGDALRIAYAGTND